MSTITISRTVAAPPEQVFDAWVQPQQLARWWWPQWPDTSYQLDVTVGGNYRIHNAANGIGVFGEFTVVDRPNTLAMTWIWADEEPPRNAAGENVVDEVTVTFTPVSAGTEVTVRHTSTEHIAGGGAEQGWNDVLDRLPAWFAGRG
ncbi:SRPBCC family protein [Nakamurella aerolata]|uniref:SRPBCC domain-containing protein n=1 Tax=Nakamurella aerolata TaxID=1656892 RepID=A0A849A9T2_9ACTN|nr:SRPBCC domain-containing protein [Nakamurella aerolata]NNG35861.1 SRPBCC domain-containing protein [Nakamurella aerolata]